MAAVVKQFYFKQLSLIKISDLCVPNDQFYLIRLNSLSRQVLSEPVFYGDLVYKRKKIVGTYSFSAQFSKILSHYKKISYVMFCNRLNAW